MLHLVSPLLTATLFPQTENGGSKQFYSKYFLSREMRLLFR